MSDERPIVHLFCNAHIDPVWMWGWEEGLREAISTFWTAANLLEEFPEFVFNHNESLLYEWVEEYDPVLFERIQHYVKEGRWNITGGWYLQPDVNMPGGETLVRIILEGRRYFAQKFGVRPTVAYNFDSFGHPCSLPQLLKQSGFELYVHCRPTQQQMELPAALRRWRGVDGSEVMTIRPDTGWYCTPRPGQAQEQARNGIAQARKTGRDALVLWGLGDHGGGATRKDLLAFREMLEEMRDADVELRHSTPEAYAERMKPWLDELPVHEGELQRTLSGTYTSVAPIKRQMREGEKLLAFAERWATIAWWRFGHPYPADKLREAWKRIMFNTFHDVLCGSLVESAIPGVNDMYGYAHDVARGIILRAQNALIPKVAPQEDTIPIYVLNPHAEKIVAPVGLNFLSAYAPPPYPKSFTLYDDQDQPVAHMKSGGHDTILEMGTWQPFVGFIAEVPPLTARRYEVRYEEVIQPGKEKITVTEVDHGLIVESPHWVAEFSREAAALTRLIDKASGKSLLQNPVQLYVMKDIAHAWGGEHNVVFNQHLSPMTALSPSEVGAFAGLEATKAPALRVYAQGLPWVTIECLVGWQHTRASLKFTFYAELPYIDIDTRLHMQARRKMVKLALPFNLNNTTTVCEVPYGATERPTDATEYPYTRWVRLESDDINVGVANDGQYGLDVSDSGVLNLSISRGGIHSSWDGEYPADTAYTFMDQEQIDTRFRLLADTDRARLRRDLVTVALELNQPLERFFAYYPASLPQGAPEKPGSFLHVEPQNVVLGALKKAEDGDALIIRLVETTGEHVTATITLEGHEPQQSKFGPYEIRTFKVTRDGAWHACNILEEVD